MRSWTGLGPGMSKSFSFAINMFLKKASPFLPIMEEKSSLLSFAKPGGLLLRYKNHEKKNPDENFGPVTCRRIVRVRRADGKSRPYY
jgi:hypothetical protein